MKKSLIFASMLLLLCMGVFVVSDTTFSWSNSNQTGTLTYTGLALVTPTIDGVSPVTVSSVAQSDTNTTTTATGYTPAHVGQVLTGGAGTGTNAVWISNGITTNDWVQIAP